MQYTYVNHWGMNYFFSNTERVTTVEKTCKFLAKIVEISLNIKP